MKTIQVTLVLAWVLAAAVTGLRVSRQEPAPEPQMHRCGVWITLADLPNPVQEHGVAATNDDMYVIGGVPANKSIRYSPKNVTMAYNFDSKSWRQVADLPFAIAKPNVAGVNGAIYVLGGFTHSGSEMDEFWNYTTTALVYHPEANRWTVLSPAIPDREARGAAAVTIHGSQIILAGGMKSVNFTMGAHQQSMSRVSAYDTHTNAWKQIRSLPEPRDHAGAFVNKDSKLFVLGGHEDGRENVKNNTWVLDLKVWNSEWINMKDMPRPRADFVVGDHMHKIILFGGVGDTKSPTSIYAAVDAYHVKRDEWKMLRPMPIPRHGMGAVSFRRNTFMAGGGLYDGGEHPGTQAELFSLDSSSIPPANFSDTNLPDDVPHGCFVY
ncbi:hypothetical protein F4803DRAFT_571999 [Xylaria telfairii]|nr:hypothetical protein F4803DRAFT_571999 [Xylaria telfairii]